MGVRRQCSAVRCDSKFVTVRRTLGSASKVRTIVINISSSLAYTDGVHR
jgi:hypothetical protein